MYSAGLGAVVVFHDLHHQRRVVREDHARAVMAGEAAHTSRERPAKISFLRPVASMA
jgi:hypothetical protein